MSGVLIMADEEALFCCAEVLLEGGIPCPSGVRYLARQVVRLLSESGNTAADVLLAAVEAGAEVPARPKEGPVTCEG
jgi:hypothetical protein